MEILFMVEILQIITATSILFVWVVRYENIIAEFEQYKLPAWMRDMVGLLRMTALHIRPVMLVKIGTATKRVQGMRCLMCTSLIKIAAGLLGIDGLY